MPTNRVYRIAVIPGDGIGKEVMPEGGVPRKGTRAPSTRCQTKT